MLKCQNLNKFPCWSRNAERRSEAKEEQVRASMSRLESQVFNTRTQVPPTIVQFHPYEHQIVVVGKETFGVWDWSTGAKLYQSRKAVFSKMSQITSMDWVNPQDVALFMTGSDDGTVSIYKPSNNNLKLVTAWQAHSDLSLGNKLNNPEGEKVDIFRKVCSRFFYDLRAIMRRLHVKRTFRRKSRYYHLCDCFKEY